MKSRKSNEEALKAEQSARKLAALIKGKYVFGDTIQHSWIKKHVWFEPPVLNMTTVPTVQEVAEYDIKRDKWKLEYRDAILKIKGLLNKELRYLTNVKGIGYKILHPHEHESHIQKIILGRAERMFAKAETCGISCDISKLTKPQLEKHTEVVDSIRTLREIWEEETARLKIFDPTQN